METALVSGHIEEGQLLDLNVGVVVDTFGPDRPVAGTYRTIAIHLLTSLVEQYLELMGGEGENLAESVTHRIYLAIPKRIALFEGGSLEVDENLIFRDAAGHQLTVTAEDVASVRFHADRVALQSVCHLRPVLLFGGHDIECLADDGKAYERYYDGDGHVARQYFIIVKLAHSSFLILRPKGQSDQRSSSHFYHSGT